MSELRTSRDLSVRGHVEDARAQLHKAIDFGTDADLAAWARRWGESAVELAELAEGLEVAKGDDLEELEAAAKKAERERDNAVGILKTAANLLEEEASGDNTVKSLSLVQDAIDALEDIDLCV